MAQLVLSLGIAFYPTTGLSVGDNLYVSTTAGSLTATAPTTEVYFAEVVKVGASGVGVVFINPTPQGIGIIPTSSADVSNPPTDAELDSAFGTPATVGNGFTALLDDAGGDTNVYAVYSNGTSWFYTTLTKAV